MSLQEKIPVSIIKQKWAKYPSYKDSGIQWLGIIPINWHTQKLKRMCKLITDGSHYSPPSQSIGKPYVTVKDLLENGIDLKNSLKISEEDFDILVKNGCKPQIGDILLSKDGTIGKVVIVKNDEFVFLSSIALLRPNSDIDANYLRYFFLSTYGLNQMLSYIAGTAIRRLTVETIIDLISVKPPLLEQKLISNYLDAQTAKLDALIVKKERFVELLQEKRTAIINQTLLCGLTPNTGMRDSGIEWIHNIPSHWEIIPLKRFSNIRYGLGQPPEESSGNVPLIRATNVKSGKIVTKDMVYVNPDDIPETRNAVLTKGEIIVVRSGALTGDSAIIPDEYAGSIAGYDMVVTVKQNLPEFIALQLLSTHVRDIQFNFYKLRAAQPHLNAEELGETLFIIPPITEQESIYNFVNNSSLKIDSLIDKIQNDIQLIKEYRAALISAAVTGKIDVRGEA